MKSALWWIYCSKEGLNSLPCFHLESHLVSLSFLGFWLCCLLSHNTYFCPLDLTAPSSWLLCWLYPNKITALIQNIKFGLSLLLIFLSWLEPGILLGGEIDSSISSIVKVTWALHMRHGSWPLAPWQLRLIFVSGLSRRLIYPHSF